jgi:hypothetical protein
MNDIIAMAREAEIPRWCDSEPLTEDHLIRFATLARADERNKLAIWMMAQGYATGHGDTTEDLLEELEREIGFDKAELWLKRIKDAVLAEREACALVCETLWDTLGNGMATEDAAYGNECAIAIRARD